MNKHKFTFLLLAVFILTISATAFAETKYMKPGREETIASEGIKFKNFKDAESKPVQPLAIAGKRTSSTGEKDDIYRTDDFWFHEQFTGNWESDSGRLIIMKMSLNVPSGLADEHEGHSTRKSYEEWKKNTTHEWNDKSKQEWVERFADEKLAETPEQIQKGISAKLKIMRYHFDNKSSEMSRLIFTIESTDRPDETYVFAYDIASSADSEKSIKTILASIPTITFSTPKKVEDKQIVTTKSIKKKDFSPEYMESKEKVIKNIKNLKGWGFIETDNFIVVLNVKNKKTREELQVNLEKCRSVFEKYYPIKNPLKAVSVCKVFEDRKDYVDYVAVEWSGGMWMPDKQELVISPVDWANSKDNRKIMTHTIFHEGFHQYVFYAADEAQCAVWFNEGNAEYFQGIDFKAGNKYEINSTEQGEMMKKLVPIDINNLLRMDYQEFYGSNRNNNYTSAWGLMFFLYKGAPIMKEKNNYSDIPSKYYDTLVETKNPAKAQEAAFEGIDIAKLNRDLSEFWGSNSLIKKADRYDPMESKEEAEKKAGKTPPAQPEKK